MKTIQVITGFGYYRNDSGIIAKAILPKGSHQLADDYDYIEVADKAALDAIQVYVDPAEELHRQREQLIIGKIREIAIEELILEGKLPGDYV